MSGPKEGVAPADRRVADRSRRSAIGPLLAAILVAHALAAFLADLPSAWTVATPTERNRLARQLFGEAIIENRTVVAVKPRPDLAFFFESLAVNPDPEITPKRKRRGSVAYARAGAQRRLGRSRRGARIR